MKVLITTGCPHSGHELIHEALRTAGVAAASPTRSLGLSPQALQKLMLDSHEVKFHAGAALDQLRPGLTWQEPAADLFLANIHAPLWGWADEQTTVLMDFWQEFDPQVRLLLVYGDPAQHLIRHFHDVRDPGPAEATAWLREWCDWNSALLAYHLRHPRRTLLVNAQRALSEPGELGRLLAEHWGVDSLHDLAAPLADGSDGDELLAHAAHALVAANHDAAVLEQQLRSSAQLPGGPLDGDVRPPEPAVLWAAACGLVSRMDARDLAQRTRIEMLDREIGVLNDRITAAQGELDRHFQNNQHLREQTEQLRVQLDQSVRQLQAQVLLSQQAEEGRLAANADLTSAQARSEEGARLAQEQEQAGNVTASAMVNELTQENELLRLQLLQIQEELELYFDRWQESQLTQRTAVNNRVADFWLIHQPPVLAVDLRRPIAGSQWYDAEDDGRWSGPARYSTLDLPPLQAGSYLLEIDVMDAMSDDILQTAQVEIGGRTQPLSVEYLGSQESLPAVCSARFDIDSIDRDSLQLGLRLSNTLAPAERGGDDYRQLGVRVQQVRLILEQSGIDF